MSAKLRQLIRVGVLRLLKATARDINIKHHWVPGQRLRIHSYKHKGYWWHGKNREAHTLASIAKVLSQGQTALDVGAHVGYFTTYFAHLVGPRGRVIAFEPSDENLVYTRPNTEKLSQVQIDTRGISNFTGQASFFVESLTGQNNSLVQDYEVFSTNAAHAGVPCEKREVKISVTTIDSACREYDVSPKLIKMDIEGAELEAIQGMRETLERSRSVVLLEVSREHHACWSFFKSLGYKALNESLETVDESVFDTDRPWPAPVNFFFVPASEY